MAPHIRAIALLNEDVVAAHDPIMGVTRVLGGGFDPDFACGFGLPNLQRLLGGRCRLTAFKPMKGARALEPIWLGALEHAEFEQKRLFLAPTRGNSEKRL